MIITSNLDSIIQRQVALGTYRPEEFIPSPYMTAYWLGHITEELAEFRDASVKNKPAEAADVIIFIQNYVALQYPDEELVIDLGATRTVHKPTDLLYLVLIDSVRQNGYNRKSWKVYNKDSFASYCQKIVEPILRLLLYYVESEELLHSYNKKLNYNLQRPDWKLRQT